MDVDSFGRELTNVESLHQYHFCSILQLRSKVLNYSLHLSTMALEPVIKNVAVVEKSQTAAITQGDGSIHFGVTCY